MIQETNQSSEQEQVDINQNPTTPQSQDPEQNIPPEVKKELIAYVGGLSRMLHSKQTSPKVVEMLKSGPPEDIVPKVALLINKQMEDAVSQKGKKPSLDILIGAAQFIVGDLIEIGNAAGIFQIKPEDEKVLGTILQNTIQTYIHQGLKDGSIDPVELQQKIEPLMPEEDRKMGLQVAQEAGLPEVPNEITAMETYANQRVRKAGALKGV